MGLYKSFSTYSFSKTRFSAFCVLIFRVFVLLVVLCFELSGLKFVVTCHRGSCGSSTIAPSRLHGYFVGLEHFLVDTSWIQSFSRGYFMGINFSLVSISWVQNFFLWVFRGSNFFSWLIL